MRNGIEDINVWIIKVAFQAVGDKVLDTIIIPLRESIGAIEREQERDCTLNLDSNLIYFFIAFLSFRNCASENSDNNLSSIFV